jgi:hypothetical protein
VGSAALELGEVAASTGGDAVSGLRLGLAGDEEADGHGRPLESFSESFTSLSSGLEKLASFSNGDLKTHEKLATVNRVVLCT